METDKAKAARKYFAALDALEAARMARMLRKPRGEKSRPPTETPASPP